MAKKNPQTIRITTDGKFQKLMNLIKDQFEKKHGFSPRHKDICEVIAGAVMDAKLF